MFVYVVYAVLTTYTHPYRSVRAEPGRKCIDLPHPQVSALQIGVVGHAIWPVGARKNTRAHPLTLSTLNN